MLAWLLPGNAVAALVGIGAGDFLLADPALYFRELMPGTVLSAAHILAAATVASAIHRRDLGGRRWHESFWGLSTVVLLTLALVELTQPTIFLSKWLRDDFGARAPAGFADLDAVLVVLLLAAVTLALARRALDLRHHPRAVGFFACAGLLAAMSQAIDATYEVSTWEFVVEDSIKALAGPFLLVGYLVVLGAVVRRQPPG